MSIQEFQCPNCGGAINFDSESQKLKCPYCDAEFEVDALKAYNESLEENEETPKDPEWENSGNEWTSEDGLNVYVCHTCGGEIVVDESTAATSCPYCGNPVVMKEKLSGDIKPDIVIPFKLDKAAAKKALMAHMSGKKMLPKEFKSENHIDEIKGVYVPFWLFESDVDADIRYKATRVRTWSDARWIYTETQFYSVLRSGSMGFDNVPVDGSSKMADELMESIEPYDFSDAVDFKTAYLAGYLADRYDVDSDSSSERARERIRVSAEQAFRNTVNGYVTVTPESSRVNISNGRVRYALLPVWILNSTYKGEKYIFAMNGQTGKMVGNMPVDKGAAARWTALITAIATVVVFLIGSVTGLF